MRELAKTRVRWGHRRLHVLLRRESWQPGRSQCYRIYGEEQLQLRSKLSKKRKTVVQCRQRVLPSTPGQNWSMDFVAEEFSHGGKFHILTVVDVFTREALAAHAGHRLMGEDIVDALNRLARHHGAPKAILVDNGREFTGR